jgi:hypothetical protein
LVRAAVPEEEEKRRPWTGEEGDGEVEEEAAALGGKVVLDDGFDGEDAEVEDRCCCCAGGWELPMLAAKMGLGLLWLRSKVEGQKERMRNSGQGGLSWSLSLCYSGSLCWLMIIVHA